MCTVQKNGNNTQDTTSNWIKRTFAKLAVALVWTIYTYQWQRNTCRMFEGVALSRHPDLAVLEKVTCMLQVSRCRDYLKYWTYGSIIMHLDTCSDLDIGRKVHYR